MAIVFEKPKALTDAVLHYLSLIHIFPVYWKQRRDCRPTAHPFARTGEGRAAVLPSFPPTYPPAH